MESTSATDTVKKIGTDSGTDTDRQIGMDREADGQMSGGTAGSRRDSFRHEYGFAPDVELKECKYCRVIIPKKAKVCPNCRMVLKSRWLLKTAGALLAVAVIGTGSYFLSAYWGLLDDSMIPGWMAQYVSLRAAVSTTAVGVEEAVADAAAAGTAETGTSAAAAQTGSGVTVIEASEAGAERTVSGSDKMTASVSGTESKESGRTEALKETEKTEEQKEQSVAAQTGLDSDDGSRSLNDGQDKDGTEEEGLEVSQAEEDQDKETSEEADEKEKAYRSECEPADYKALLRKQEEYLNTSIMVEAQVMSLVNGGLFDEHRYYLCMAAEKNGIERYYIIRDDRENDDTLILEGDMITVYGELFGNCKIPAELIHTRPTVPAVSMKYFDLQ